MSSSHRQKMKSDMSRGLAEQIKVMGAYALSRGGRWFPSTSSQDIGRKFDGIIHIPGSEPCKIQYKGVIRNIPAATVLFEYTNVNGDRGWGRGFSDYVVQRVNEDTLFCYSRQKALDFLVERVGEPGAAVQRLDGRDAKPTMQWCGRAGRMDVVVYVPIDTLGREIGGRYRKIRGDM